MVNKQAVLTWAHCCILLNTYRCFVMTAQILKRQG